MIVYLANENWGRKIGFISRLGFRVSGIETDIRFKSCRMLTRILYDERTMNQIIKLHMKELYHFKLFYSLKHITHFNNIYAMLLERSASVRAKCVAS